MMGLALRASHIKKLEGDVWELRPEFGGTEYRIFFGRQGETFVLLHAIAKKRQKVSRNDITLAQRRFNEWKERHEHEDEL